MNKKIKKQVNDFYDSVSRLGLTVKDIEGLVKNNIAEPITFSIGPNYHGTHYGTISINDFD